MKTSKQGISVLLSYLCCCMVLSSSCSSRVFSPKTSKDQQYRITRVKYYSSEWDFPEIVNDSTASLTHETVFFYDDEGRLDSAKREYKIRDRSYEMHSYLITYTDSTNMLSVLFKGERFGEPFAITNSWKTDDFFRSEYFRLIGDFINSHLVCDGDCYLIERSSKQYSKYYILVHPGCCNFHFFLNDNGYIEKKVVQASMSANISIYEYEYGKNPYKIVSRFAIKHRKKLNE
jgi:hypothetical protein